LADYQFPPYHPTRPQHNHESLNNKINQHRKSRDRYEFNSKDVSIGQTRNQGNKENFYYENAKYN
jgi:hypothetical protein